MRKFLIFAALAIATAFIVYWFWGRQTSNIVEIANTRVSVEVAQSAEEQAKGLSGRSSLKSGSGMLFVYEGSDYPGIWMKEMQFPIDIIWIDETGQVVSIENDVSPDTYPQAFYPSKPSKYVLEVPAGFILEHNITIGNKVKIPEL